MSRESYALLLAEFGKAQGIDHLVADADGYCTFHIDESFYLNITYDEALDRVTVYTEIGKYSEEQPKEFFIDLLEANFFWTGTSGATLGINTQEKTILLAYPMPLAGLDHLLFSANLERFVNTVEYWMKRIHGSTSDEASPSSSTEQEEDKGYNLRV